MRWLSCHLNTTTTSAAAFAKAGSTVAAGSRAIMQNETVAKASTARWLAVHD